MMRRALSGIAMMAIAAAVACDCEGAGSAGSEVPSGSSIQITQTSPESTIGPSIQITHISPESSSRVHVGDRVDLEVTASYTQAAESGSITLVVQAADGSTIANHWEVVARGSGTVTLKTSFVVPETSSIGVFMPLSAEGQGVTSTVDARTYIVEAK